MSVRAVRPIDLVCPYCWALRYQPCVVINARHVTTWPHEARRAAARRSNARRIGATP